MSDHVLRCWLERDMVLLGRPILWWSQEHQLTDPTLQCREKADHAPWRLCSMLHWDASHRGKQFLQEWSFLLLWEKGCWTNLETPYYRDRQPSSRRLKVQDQHWASDGSRCTRWFPHLDASFSKIRPHFHHHQVRILLYVWSFKSCSCLQTAHHWPTYCRVNS